MSESNTVLITGSSKGLGEELARIFVSNGYNIILHGRDLKKLEMLKEQFTNQKIICEVVAGELSDEKTLSYLAEKAKSLNVDIVINNAAVYKRKAFKETSEEDFRQIINVNLMAPIILLKKIFPYFEEKKSGLIININSFAGKNSGDGESAYCTSKHGLRGFSGSMQFDLNRIGVRLIEIYLGAMNTQMVDGRKDSGMCIQTSDASDLIYKLCSNYKSMRISEVDLLRRLY